MCVTECGTASSLPLKFRLESSLMPTKRKAMTRKSMGSVPIGRRLPTGSSSSLSARRTSGARSAWGGGGRGGEEGSSKRYAHVANEVVEFFFCGRGSLGQAAQPKKRFRPGTRSPRDQKWHHP